MRASLRKMDLVCCVLVLAAVTGAGMFVWTMNARAARRYAAARLALQKAEQELDVAQEAAQRLAASLNAAQRELSDLNDMIPGAGQIGTFVERIGALADQRQTLLEDIQLQDAFYMEPYQCIPVTVRTRGAFDQLYAFLHDIETMERVARIESVSFGRGSDAYSCSMRLLISLFEK